jgi:hypothetical protein
MPDEMTALLALGGFVTIVLVPALKYPANPPSVGNPETIGLRTELFFVMLVISVAALVLAVALARRLSARYGAWNATLIAGAAFVVVIAIVQYVLPEINEVPEQFSAVVLWRFRVGSLGIHVVLWTTIGLLFGALAERSFAERSEQRLSVGAVRRQLPRPRAERITAGPGCRTREDLISTMQLVRNAGVSLQKGHCQSFSGTVPQPRCEKDVRLGLDCRKHDA